MAVDLSSAPRRGPDMPAQRAGGIVTEGSSCVTISDARALHLDAALYVSICADHYPQ